MDIKKSTWKKSKSTELKFAFELPFDVMLNFLDGKLDVQTHRQVEEYITTHPEEQDALEGIKIMRASQLEETIVGKQLSSDVDAFVSKFKSRLSVNKKKTIEQLPKARQPLKLKHVNEINHIGPTFLSNFSVQLLKKRSLSEAYAFICDTVQTVLNSRGASLFLYAKDGRLTRVCISGFYRDLAPIPESFDNGQGFVGKTIADRDSYGKTQHTNNLEEIVKVGNDPLLKQYLHNYKEAIFLQYGLEEHINHIITTPLDAFRRSMGVIRVINKLDKSGEKLEEGGFTSEDIAILELIASISANTLSYLKLEERENVLNNIPNLLHTYGEEGVYDAIARSIINDSTLYSTCMIRIVAPQNRHLILKGTSEKEKDPDILKIKVDEGVSGIAFYSDDHVEIENFHEDPKNFIYTDWAVRNMIVSMISFPLQSANGTIRYGTLSVYTQFKFKFGQDDIRYLKSFANQISRIIELIQDDHEQRLLRKISHDLIKESNLEDLMWQTAGKLSEATGFDRCRFLICDEQNFRIITRNRPPFEEIPLENNISKRIQADPEQVLSFTDVACAPDLHEMKEYLDNVRALVIVPIHSADRRLFGLIILTTLISKEEDLPLKKRTKAVQNLITKLNFDILLTISNLFSCSIEKLREKENKEEYEKQLIEERHLLRTLIDKVPDLIYIKDEKHNFVLVNKAQTQILGASTSEEAIGKSDMDFFPKKDAILYKKKEEDLFNGKIELIDVIEDVPDPNNGNIKIFKSTKKRYKNSAGKYSGLVGIGRDITDLKKTETELRNTVKSLTKAKTDAENAVELIKRQYNEFKQTVSIVSDKLISEYGPDSKVHIYARIIAADYFVERELFAKYLSNQSLKTKGLIDGSFNSVFDDTFENIIKFTPEALGKNASVILNVDKGGRRRFQLDKTHIQDIVLSLIMNAIKHKVSGYSPTIYIETSGKYLSIKNNCQHLPENIDHIKKEVSSSVYSHQGSTLFTIDKYFRQNYKQKINIDIQDDQFIVGLPLSKKN